MYNTWDYLFNIRSNFNALLVSYPKQISHIVDKLMTICLLFLLSHIHHFHCVLLIQLNRIEKLLSQFCRIDKKKKFICNGLNPNHFSLCLCVSLDLVSFFQIFQSIFQTSHFFFFYWLVTINDFIFLSF